MGFGYCCRQRTTARAEHIREGDAMLTKKLAWVVCLGALAGCSSTGSSDFDVFADRVNDGVALAERVDGLAFTAFDAVPSSGSAEFAGLADVFADRDIDASSDDLSMIGDVAITVDFTAGTVTGDISNFAMAENLRLNEGDVSSVEGSLALGDRSSNIGRAAPQAGPTGPNAGDTSYDGTLQTRLGDVTVAGELTGRFAGTRVNNPDTDFPIKAMIGDSQIDDATLGDETVVFDISIYAENDGS